MSPLQLGVLPLQPIVLRGLLRAYPGSGAGIDLRWLTQLRTVSPSPMPSSSAIRRLAYHSEVFPDMTPAFPRFEVSGHP